jgi:hypothetical protein
MRKNEKLEELKLYIAQRMNEEQNLYSKLVADLDAQGKGLDEIERTKRFLEKLYIAKNEILEEILEKIRNI